jgi:hypothetical protein
MKAKKELFYWILDSWEKRNGIGIGTGIGFLGIGVSERERERDLFFVGVYNRADET